MSLDRNLENYHEAYAEADPVFKAIIDQAYEAVTAVFKKHGWPVRNDDTAENLCSALVKYAVIAQGADLNQQLKPPPKVHPSRR